MKPSRSEFVQVRHRRLHVRCWGPEGAPLLFMLHGWGDVAASFQFVVDALQREWRVLAPDWRGFGLSEGNRDAYWFPEYLADLDGLVAHYSPQEPVRLVAHSMGANVAGIFAGVRPQRVAGLVNLEGLGLPPHPADEAPGRYATWLDQLGTVPRFRAYAGFDEFAARLCKENPRLAPGRAAFLARHMGAETAAGTVELAADPCHRWINPVGYRVEEAMACWRAMTAPVLLVTGGESFIFKEFFARDSAEFARRRASFRDLREVSLPACGHNLHHEAPEELARLIEEFFA